MKRSIIAYVQGRKSRTSIGTRSLDPIYTVSYYINWVNRIYLYVLSTYCTVQEEVTLQKNYQILYVQEVVTLQKKY